MALVVACGGKPAPQGPGSGSDVPVPQDNRTTIEKRRDAACDQLAKRNTACAVEDTKRDLAAGKITQKQYDEDADPKYQAGNTQKFADKCKAQHLNSYQVRVYEVCMRDEPSDCDALMSCLQHVKDGK